MRAASRGGVRDRAAAIRLRGRRGERRADGGVDVDARADARRGRSSRLPAVVGDRHRPRNAASIAARAGSAVRPPTRHPGHGDPGRDVARAASRQARRRRRGLRRRRARRASSARGLQFNQFPGRSVRRAVRPSPYRRTYGVRHLAARALLASPSARACRRARDRRGDGLGARPPRLRRAGRGTPLPRRRAARPRPVRARRHARGGRGDRRRRSRRARGSACTATTTPTASARPRSPCCSCASSAPTSRGTCRRGSRRATA